MNCTLVRSSRTLLVSFVVLTLASTGLASAAQAPATVVSEDPSDLTPRTEPTGLIQRPHVDALARAGDTVYAGGLFGAVSEAADPTTFLRSNLMSFDATSGVLTDLAPQFDGPVDALAATPDALYVGGDFSTVDGVTRRSLVKLDPVTGEVDPEFDAGVSGKIKDVELVGSRLFVSGSGGKKLMALDPVSGADTGYLDFAIAGKIENSWGKTSVNRFAVNPQQTQLAAVGNFKTVNGQVRHRAFLLDLGETTATLNPWYYNYFTRPCASTTAQRQAYLTDVDFSADGTWFVVSATGYTPRLESEWGTMVCDAIARFAVDDVNPQEPVWINYTGGDSVWSVVATPAAVYAQGHFRYLDNKYGNNVDGPAPTAVLRKGVGAMDPDTGLALDWNPAAGAKIGGKAFLATPAGIWFGADSRNFAGEYHRGLAFCPAT